MVFDVVPKAVVMKAASVAAQKNFWGKLNEDRLTMPVLPLAPSAMPIN
jgi:hypothetical protein